jgi:hypothetical protein
VVSAGSTTAKLNATGLQTVTVASTTLKADTIYYASIVATIGSLTTFTFGSASASRPLRTRASAFAKVRRSAPPLNGGSLWGFVPR